MLAFLIASALLAGCGGGGRPPIETEVVPYDQEQLLARESAKQARYRLRIGDRFSVAFKYEPELDVENVLVLPDGYISLKGLPVPVRAAGVTIDDLDRELEAAYSKDFKNPDLSVLIIDVASPEVYVLGAVRLPGLYRLPEKGRGIAQAVAMAGGFRDDAKKSQIVLMRASDKGFLTRRYDLSRLAEGVAPDLLIFDLEPYDVLYVPRSSLSKFSDAVQMVFGSVLKVSGFFWDVYAFANMDKIDTVVR